jgi:hypothetical protein
VAYAGSPVALVPQDAIVLPGDLLCGFIAAGFGDAIVRNSFVVNTFTNTASPDETRTSFVDDGSAGGLFVSPHDDTFFDFGPACGDNCVDNLCVSDGTTTCTTLPSPLFTTECPGVGTGPGLVIPFLANGPGSIPSPPGSGVPPVFLTPTAAGFVNIGLPYSGIALNLPSVGAGTAAGCVGGACDPFGEPDDPGTPNLPSLCAPQNRSFDIGPCDTDTNLCTGVGNCPVENVSCTPCTDNADCVTPDRISPLNMYDSICDKIGLAACGGTGCDTAADCPLNDPTTGQAPIGQQCDTSAGGPDDFAGVCTNVNAGTCGLAVADECLTTGLDCSENGDDDCDPVLAGLGIPVCCSPFDDFNLSADICKGAGIEAADVQAEATPPCCDPTLPGIFPFPNDVFCQTDPNRLSCCRALGTAYPSLTDAQLPQLPVNAP